METVMCICAHSDDEIFGPGGTLAKYAKEGKRVITIILSYGELSHPHFKEDVIVETRVKEAEDADKIIGGHGVVFYGLKEGRFVEDMEKRKLMKKLVSDVKKYAPVKIFTHANDDPHPDHRATFAIVKELYDKASLGCEVYTFDVWTPFSTKKRDAPKLVVDVGSTFRTKLRALKCFKSQLGFWGILNYYPYASMLAKNFFAGLQYNYRFAEVFYKFR